MSAEILVTDASAMAALLFDEPEAGIIAEILETGMLTAPSLLPYEIASVTRKKIMRRPEHMNGILAASALLDRMRIEMVRVPHIETARLALRTGLSVYDASYLWLTMELDATLVALDSRLSGAALRTGVTVLPLRS